MAFDDRAYTETTHEVFTLDGLIAWLERQPGARRYNYCDTGGCLLYQYFTTRGVPIVSLNPYKWAVPNGRHHDYPRARDVVAIGYPRTFRAALKRARLLAERQP